MANLLRVFVYGTLKRGEPNHHVLSSKDNGFSEFQSEGKTAVKYPLVVGTRYNIPFLLNRPGTGNNIVGEIYKIDEKMLTNLDVLEDYPNFYDRQIQDILVGDDKIKCWVYLLKTFPEKLLSLPHLTDYKNTPEKAYQESYEDSCTLEDLYE